MKRLIIALFTLVTIYTSTASLATTTYDVTFYNHTEAVVLPGDIVGVDCPLGGLQICSFRPLFVNPGDQLVLDIVLPLDFLGAFYWATTSQSDFGGQGFSFGTLYAGESATITLGGWLFATVENPVGNWLSVQAPQMAAASMSLPMQLPATSAVPIPPAVWLFGSGLLGLVGIARRTS